MVAEAVASAIGLLATGRGGAMDVQSPCIGAFVVIDEHKHVVRRLRSVVNPGQQAHGSRTRDVILRFD
jgi:hypothetical protein